MRNPFARRRAEPAEPADVPVCLETMTLPNQAFLLLISGVGNDAHPQFLEALTGSDLADRAGAAAVLVFPGSVNALSVGWNAR